MIRDELTSPYSKEPVKVMLLGSGEIGKEVIIEAKRLGMYVIAVDRYEHAPGHQVADKAYTGNMKDAAFLRKVIEDEKPGYIVPEIEAINLDLLFDLEKEGFNIIPNAKATHRAMQRERIRETISKEAGVKTSRYAYATTKDGLKDACEKVGYPCWAKAIMSSSGHGSCFVRGPKDIDRAYEIATTQARGSGEKIIVEQHIDFDIEVTELVVRHLNESGKVITSFPKPVGHYQIEGDYHSSWQPAEVSEKAEKKIYESAKKITDVLGGQGLFGCELFVKGDEVYANEISPRPHDTGMVTFVTHQTGFSQAGLHVRAITGMPIPTYEHLGQSCIPMLKPGATHVVLSPCEGKDPKIRGLWRGLNTGGVSFMWFGKPEAHVGRRLGLVLATAENSAKAKELAEKAAHKLEISTPSEPKWKKQIEKEKHLAL